MHYGKIRRTMADMGHEQPIYDVRILSACPPIATKSLRRSAMPRGLYLDEVGRRSSSGSLAKLTAIRRASSLVSSFAAERRPNSSSK